MCGRTAGGPSRGPPAGAAQCLGCLILNVALPVATLPLMSSARHLIVVVSSRWNTSPGSRGPVESHSADCSVGFDPSIV